MSRARRPRQGQLIFRQHGGKRAGAGRKPKGKRAAVPHAKRPPLNREKPVHVTLRVMAGLPRLRRQRAFRAIRACIRDAHKSFFSVVEFSVQQNHLHLLCEANDRKALGRGMSGLQIRIAKALNRLWERSGRVFADRYHARILGAPLEVKHALSYVLNNARRHAWQYARKVLPRGWVDPFSSAEQFDGFSERFSEGHADDVTQPPRTWLLRIGWRRRGLLRVAGIPGQ